MKWIKKLSKCMLIFIAGIIGIIAVLIGITIVNTNWHTKKFRFENFKTSEELIAYIKTNFPNGSDSKPLIDLLKTGGAKCEIIAEEYYDKEDKKLSTHCLYELSYSAGWLYYPPPIRYCVYLWVDKNQNIIKFSAIREWRGL